MTDLPLPMTLPLQDGDKERADGALWCGVYVWRTSRRQWVLESSGPWSVYGYPLWPKDGDK